MTSGWGAILACWAILLLLVLGGRTEPALAEGDGLQVTLDDYRARIDAATQALSQADEAVALPAARAVLDPIDVVRLPSGEEVVVAPLLPDHATRETALNRVRLVQRQLAAADGDATAARLATLQQVLSRREFATRDPETSLWDRLREWILEWLATRQGMESPRLGNAVAQGAVWLIAGGGGIVLALVLSYWLQGLLSSFVADAGQRRRQETGEAEPVTAAAARQQAQQLAQGGRYRPAVRQLYLAALLHLEERGALHADRSLTNRECLTQVAGNAAVRQHLEPVVQTFDEVWYGVREPDAETFRHYQQQIDALNEQVP